MRVRASPDRDRGRVAAHGRGGGAGCGDRAGGRDPSEVRSQGDEDGIYGFNPTLVGIALLFYLRP